MNVTFVLQGCGAPETGAMNSGGCATWCHYEGCAVWKTDPSCQACTKDSINGQCVGGEECKWAMDTDPRCNTCPEACAHETGSTSSSCAPWCRNEGCAVWKTDPSCQGCTKDSINGQCVGGEECRWSMDTNPRCNKCPEACAR